jgi:hypothetical protein
MMMRSYGSVMIVLLVLGLSSAAIWMAGEALGDSPQELLARAEKALSFVTDPAALLWTADNWGALFGYDPWQGMANVGKVKAMYERCLEVDETYWGGSCHNALGALLVTTPDFLGGDLEEGKRHLERAIELDFYYLENHVVYAQYWGFTYDFLGRMNGVRDRELIERELSFVLEAPIGRWPFWNREAKKEAELLLKKLEEFLHR